MAFRWETKQFRWLKDYVASFPEKAEWTIVEKGKTKVVPVAGVVIHHTFIPDQSSWRGRSTMEGMRNYYKMKGWSAGPHLFIAKQTLNIRNDGIWQGTPLQYQGIHSVGFNRDRVGLEVVGFFDDNPWSPELEHVIIQTTIALLTWMGKDWRSVNGHREDKVTGKSCPGRSIDMNKVRKKIKTLMEERDGRETESGNQEG